MTTEATAPPSGRYPSGAEGSAATTADPVSTTRSFWESIARGQRDLAAEVAASIAAPLVTQFSFEDEFGTTGGSAAGTLRLQVEAGTPTPVVTCWNSEKAVFLTKLEVDLCLAAVSKVEPGTVEFKACGLYKRSLKLEGGRTNCTFQSHNAYPQGSRVVRLELEGAEITAGVYAITFPAASAATKPSVFSSPLFRVSTWPASLLAIGRHELLLTVEARPSVWRLLLESYPGEVAIAEFAEGRVSPARVGVASSSNEERFKREFIATPHRGLEAVVKAPGLKSVLRDYAYGASSARGLEAGGDHTEPGSRGGEGPPPSQPSQQRPPTPGQANQPSRRLFPWERGEGSEEEGDDERSQEDSRGGDSFSTLQSTNLLAQLNRVVKGLSKRLEEIEAEGSAREISLGTTIAGLRSKVRSLEREREERDRASFLPVNIQSGAGDGGGGLTSRDRELMANEVRASINLNGYVTHRDLDDLHLINRVRLHEHCVGLVTQRELAAFDYVDPAYLDAQNFTTPLELRAELGRLPGIPAGLQDRVAKLEQAVLGADGFLAKHEARLQAIEDRNVGKAVTMGGMTFKDPSDVDAMFSPLGKDEYSWYAWDFSVQVTLALRDTMSMAETLSLKASAKKAGYSNHRAALVKSTFETTYPDSIFKSSMSTKDADQGGIVFKPAFASFETFEGNAEYSTHSIIKAQLTANMEMHQTTIDMAFPADQPRSAKHNAVFTSILRRGYAQANGMFNSIRPVNKLITTGGGTSKKQGWEKIARYLKAIFLRVGKVRTITSDLKAHTMLFGAMKATEMLDHYHSVDWFRHPDVSSTLVMTALQHQGSYVTAADFAAFVGRNNLNA